MPFCPPEVFDCSELRNLCQVEASIGMWHWNPLCGSLQWDVAVAFGGFPCERTTISFDRYCQFCQQLEAFAKLAWFAHVYGWLTFNLIHLQEAVTF